MKRFDIITEADARVLEIGETVALRKGGHVTPLAADTLKARRVTVVAEDVRRSQPTTASRRSADIRRVAIGSDHTGLALKAAIVAALRAKGIAVDDLGTLTAEPVDYPDTAARVAKSVARGEADAGIVIDGAGIGSSIAANKIEGRSRGRVPRSDDGAVCAAAQRRQRAEPRIDADSDERSAAIVDVWLDTPMTEAAIHPAARKNPRARELEYR